MNTRSNNNSSSGNYNNDSIEEQSLHESMLLNEVSSIALQNFIQMNKVLKDVDHWCEVAKEKTNELQSKLNASRESTESLPHSSMNIESSAPNYYSNNNNNNNVLNVESSSYSSKDSFMPIIDSNKISSNDAIFRVRASLADRLVDNLDNILKPVTNKSSVIKTSNIYDRNSNVDDDVIAHPKELFKSNHRVSYTYNYYNKDNDVMDEIKGSEFEDSVLMEDNDDIAAGDDDDHDDDRYYGHDDDNDNDEKGQDSPVFITQTNVFQNKSIDEIILHDSSSSPSKRPIIWAPGPYQPHVEDFAANDPFFAQQLGFVADKNEILARFDQIILNSKDDNADTASRQHPQYYNLKHQQQLLGIKTIETLIPESSSNEHKDNTCYHHQKIHHRNHHLSLTAHVDDYNNDDDDEIINIVNSVDVNDYDNNNNQSVAPSLRN